MRRDRVQAVLGVCHQRRHADDGGLWNAESGLSREMFFKLLDGIFKKYGKTADQAQR